MALMQGFCTPQSADPGQSIYFRASTTAPSYQVTILRTRNAPVGSVGPEQIRLGQELTEEGVDNPRVLINAVLQEHNPFYVDGRLCQGHPPDQDCFDWPVAFELEITDEWKSGMYAAKCVDSDRSVFYIVFVVNPNPGRRNKILVLANANTWNAYNDMGGYSRYEIPAPEGTPRDQPYRFSYNRPNPQLYNPSIPDGDQSPLSNRGYNNVPFQSRHLARGEMWFLNWLQAAGYSFDLTTDLDWHFGVADVNAYRAVILHTHPEYWSIPMMNNLDTYLHQGGTLLYLGGNGLYDAVDIDIDAKTGDLKMTVFGAGVLIADRGRLFRNIGMPESRILGVRYVEPGTGDDEAGPYTVKDAAHRFFDGVQSAGGTTVQNGDLIGTAGWCIPVGGEGLDRGAASGWEIDTWDPANPPDLADGEKMHILASDGSAYSLHPGGADLITYRHRGGGFVLSAGSIRFAGSVVVNEAVGRIVTNALDEATRQVPRSGVWLGWKGKGSDPRLFYNAGADSAYWSDQFQVGGGTSDGPALAAFNGRLYLAWKGVGDDPRIFYNSSPDGQQWTDQFQVGGGTSHAPALAPFQVG